MSHIAGSVVVTRRRMSVHAASGKRSRTHRVTAYNCLIWLPRLVGSWSPHQAGSPGVGRVMLRLPVPSQSEGDGLASDLTHPTLLWFVKG